jgi:hypothetical protein
MKKCQSNSIYWTRGRWVNNRPSINEVKIVKVNVVTFWILRINYFTLFYIILFLCETGITRPWEWLNYCLDNPVFHSRYGQEISLLFRISRVPRIGKVPRVFYGGEASEIRSWSHYSDILRFKLLSYFYSHCRHFYYCYLTWNVNHFTGCYPSQRFLLLTLFSSERWRRIMQ